MSIQSRQTDSINTVDQFGNMHLVLEYSTFRTLFQSDSPPEVVKTTSEYCLEDRSPVNRIDDDNFEIALSKIKLKKA